MDLLTQKSRWKNVKIDVVLEKTLGILGRAGFFHHPVTIRGNNLHSGHSRAFPAAHHPTVSTERPLVRFRILGK